MISTNNNTSTASFSSALTRWTLIVLGILYACGIGGMLSPMRLDFARLTPIHLLLSLTAVLYFHPRTIALWRLVLFACLAASLGFFAEVVGVATQKLFGAYHYDTALGAKWLDVPWSMSVNWLLTSYCCAVVANHLLPSSAWYWRTIAAAALMVSLDVLIEPVAMRCGFWSWQNDIVPMQNYVAWFAIALPIEALFFALLGHVRNKIAVAVFLFQYIFFAILGYWL